MSILNYISSYVVILIMFLGIDSVWLSQVAPKLYKTQIGHLLAQKPSLLPAAVFYMIFALGLLVFVIVPAVNKDSFTSAIIFGALFGLVTYATFDLTSQSVFKEWPVFLTIVDILWGITVTTITSILSFLIIKRFVV